jgi:tRNA acetyltransferase TAN1
MFRAVIFFKTVSPIVPTELVRVICEDAANRPERKQTRSVKRLTPMTTIGKATEKGLEEVAQQVLAPHFHQDGAPGKTVSATTACSTPSGILPLRLCLTSRTFATTVGTSGFAIG